MRLPGDHAAARLAAEPSGDREPIAEALRQGASFAAVLQDVQDRIDEYDVGNPHVPALNRQEGAGFAVICFMIAYCSIFMSL